MPSIHPSSYAWERYGSGWQRKALAGEWMWKARSAVYREIFVFGSLTLEKVGCGIRSGELGDAVGRAWRRFRWEVPEVGIRAVWEGEEVRMRYLPFGGHGESEVEVEAEVDRWVGRTLDVEVGRWEGIEEGDSEVMRGRIRRLKVQTDAQYEDQAFLCVYGDEDEYDGQVKHVKLLLNVDHQITDGIGARIMFGKFLTLLAVTLNQPEAFTGDLDWEESAKNLFSPWILMMNEKQVYSGPDHNRLMESNRQFIFEKMPTNPGLPISYPPPPTTEQKTHFITITKSQTTCILQHLKTLPAKTTITHLGHASMILALLRSNPATASDTLYSPCWLNGRRYLQPSATHPEPMLSFVPVCVSFAPLEFAGLGEWVLEVGASRVEFREMLERVCRKVSEEYARIRERSSVLPGNVEWMEDVGRTMWRQKQEQNKKAASSIEGSKRQRTADPFFLSDGITEQYINHSYYSDPDVVETSTRKRIFEVDEIKFAANVEKNLIVRISTWRGKTTISGEWISSFDHGMIVKFLEDVVEIMLSVMEEATVGLKN